MLYNSWFSWIEIINCIGKMTSKFLKKINSVEWLLTDGAMGTNLFDMGLMSGDAPELWNEKYPKK